MRQWIPLDVRNVDNPVALRNQLRRLNEYMNDLAASLAPTSLVPQQPDSLTIFNDFLQNIVITGGDPKNLAFFDDFIADLQADPSPGASGAWRYTSGAGCAISTDSGNVDPGAIGVWKFSTAAAVGAASNAMSPSDGAIFPLALVPGLRIGARIRLDVTDFTRGLFSFGFTDANLSSSNAQQGTNRFAFVLWHADADYYTAGNLFQNEALFEAAYDPGSGVQYTSLRVENATDYMSALFKNVEFRVTAEQAVACYVNGALQGTIAGASVPASTKKLALRIRSQTNGNTNPGVNQLSYIDRIYIDTSDMDRGKI
jgi:hypothetical protein